METNREPVRIISSDQETEVFVRWEDEDGQTTGTEYARYENGEQIHPDYLEAQKQQTGREKV